MKITLTTILFGAALTMTACAGESNDQPQSLDDRARADVGTDVIPTDTVTEYAAFGKQALEPAITRAASMDVVLNFEGSRAKPAIRGGLRSKPLGAPVVLADGHEPSDETAASIQQHVRTRLSAYHYPRRVEFVTSLPKTLTGKIRRIELREAEAQRVREGAEAH